MGLHEDVAAAEPKLVRGKAWCRHCGTELTVNAARCMRQGWPTCCGETVTIDSPEEREARARRNNWDAKELEDGPDQLGGQTKDEPHRGHRRL